MPACIDAERGADRHRITKRRPVDVIVVDKFRVGGTLRTIKGHRGGVGRRPTWYSSRFFLFLFTSADEIKVIFRLGVLANLGNILNTKSCTPFTYTHDLFLSKYQKYPHLPCILTVFLHMEAHVHLDIHGCPLVWSISDLAVHSYSK